MKCPDIHTALGTMQQRPGQPFELTDAHGRTVRGMATDSGFELINARGGLISCTADDAAAFTAFMRGPVTLQEMDAARYFQEGA